jgi:hypothetical protein
MSRALKQLVNRTLVGLLLFMQLAVAAYACPTLFPVVTEAQERAMSSAVHEPMAGDANSHMQAMGDCMETDKDNPNLCAGHCHYGQQNFDRASTPSVSPALLTGLYVIPLPQEKAVLGLRVITSDVLPSAAPPPLAVLHCCFRI